MLEELSTDLQDLCFIVGEEKFYVICNHFKGASVYFPKYACALLMREQIKAEYKKGVSYKELAKRYGYSLSWIRKICNG